MKKFSFVLGGISIFLGLGIFTITYILNQLIPKLGRMAFQAAAAGSYDATDYLMDFTPIYTLAAMLVLIGVILPTYFYYKD